MIGKDSVRIAVTMPRSVMDEIDKRRRRIPKSAYIVHLIEKQLSEDVSA